MLICPQCQFENPDANKFCQNCGTSLTEKICDECSNNIPLDAENCPICGAPAEIVWWAIIVQKVEKETIPQASTFLGEGEYLDKDKRYRLNSTVESNSETGIFSLRVVDCQPLQKTALKTLRDREPELLEEIEKASDNFYLRDVQYWNLVGVPTLALPYLALQKFSPFVPKIHDAWLTEDKEIVLLSDRSRWQLLSEFWKTEDSPLLHILWALSEMTKLWNSLSPFNYCQSLLERNNLRVDEDQFFCLQELYLEPKAAKPTLKDLVQTWQLWLDPLLAEQYEPLRGLLNRVVSGEIESAEQFREQLQELVDAEENARDDLSAEITEGNELESVLGQLTQHLDNEEEEMLFDGEDEESATVMLPMQIVSLADAGCTNTGSQRNHNEDFFCINREIKQEEDPLGKILQARGFYVVCDGMGGHAAGEVASAMAVKTVFNYFKTHWQEGLPDRETIEKGVLLANKTLYKINIEKARSGSGRMGTTLVMALVHNTEVAIASVGDSRIYLLGRQSGLRQLTTDHEVGQREIKKGVEPKIAYARPDAYQLTQALGPRDNDFVQPDFQFLEIKEDSLLLLCSDGLFDNNLIENHYETYLTPLISSSADLEQGLIKLIDFANEYNGHDNITGIIVRIKLQPNLDRRPF